MISCAITAGGKASRMHGKTKAFSLIDNERIIDRNLKILKSLFSEIIIISNRDSEFTEYKDIPTYKDEYKNIGPLAGLHSAIKNSKEDAVFLISSDLPFISRLIIEKLIIEYKKDESEAIIPKIGNNIEPLFGIYNCSILSLLENHIENGNSKSMKSLLNIINTKYIEIDDNKENRRAFTNVNTPNDLAKANY